MKYDSFFPFHVTPTANGWSIDERTNYGTTLRQRIIEFDDKSVAEYVCDRLNVWAKDKLYDLEAKEEVDGFCNDIYNAGYDKGVQDQRFFLV